MDRLKTVATFVAGVLVGGGAVYFSPPSGGDALSVPPGSGQIPVGPASGQPMDPSMAGAGMVGQGGMPPGAEGMQPGQMPPGGMPGQNGAMPGQNGAMPGQNGAMPGQAGAMPGQNGAMPGQAGAVPGQVTPGAPPDATMAATSLGQPGGTPLGPPDPKDAAEGPAPEETPAAPANLPPQGGGRLEKHIRNASTLWGHVKDQAQASKNPAAKALVPDVQTHIEELPTIGEHMPPMQEVASYLASSRILLDKLDAAGLDVAELSLQIDTLMRPPRGKIPGGPKGEAGK